MITDIRSVMWKEWREILRQSGSKRSTAGASVLMMAIMGIFMPWQAGIEWLTTPASLGLWVVIPVLLIATAVADSFAGERERRTLETLLATRLSDRAILFGKIGATVSYAWVMAQVVLLIALVVVNVRFWDGQLLLYRADVALGGLGLSFLMASLMSTIGILVSLRANSVKQAQQTLGLAVFILAWAPILALQLLPAEWEARLGQALKAFLASGADWTQAILIVAAALAVLTAGFLAVAMARFQRPRLILD